MAYWPAVYAFIRHEGRSPSDAEDLTQDFLCRVIGTEMLKGTSSDQGCLRTLLAVILKRFLIDDYRRASTEKRGGSRIHLTIDTASGESYLDRLGCDHDTPDRFFDRAFAATLMDRAINQLRDHYLSQEKVRVFDVLKPSLLGATQLGELSDWASQLDTSQATVRVAVHRLRKRFRETFRTVVLETVVNPDDLDEELTALLEASS